MAGTAGFSLLKGGVGFPLIMLDKAQDPFLIS